MPRSSIASKWIDSQAGARHGLHRCHLLSEGKQVATAGTAAMPAPELQLLSGAQPSAFEERFWFVPRNILAGQAYEPSVTTRAHV